MKPKLRTAGCFIEHDNKILLLRRRPDKPLGGTWGLPAGKVESGESDLETIVRETYEETGIRLDPKEFEFLGDFIFDFPYLYLEFPTFRVILETAHTVKISHTEHQDFRWITPVEAYGMSNLIDGLHDLLVMTKQVQDRA